MIQRIAHKAFETFVLLRRGEWHFALHQISRWAYSDRASVGLRRELSASVETPAPRIPVTVRPLEPIEVSTMLALEPRMSGAEIHERMQRAAFHGAGIPTCYGAVTADGVPCCMQWLILPDRNSDIGTYFGGLFPPLAQDEGLLEHSYTVDRFRRQGIMSYVISEIARRVATTGTRRLLTFVPSENVVSLEVVRHAGFVPYAIRTERWRLFRRTSTFGAPATS